MSEYNSEDLKNIHIWQAVRVCLKFYPIAFNT